MLIAGIVYGNARCTHYAHTQKFDENKVKRKPDVVLHSSVYARE